MFNPSQNQYSYYTLDTVVVENVYFFLIVLPDFSPPSPPPSPPFKWYELMAGSILASEWRPTGTTRDRHPLPRRACCHTVWVYIHVLERITPPCVIYLVTAGTNVS